MRTRSSLLLAAALAVPLLLAGCGTPSADPTRTPPASAPSDAPTGDVPSGGEHLADLSEFPAHFPLPGREPVFVDRVNYQWTIDYVFEDDTEPVDRAEWFGANGYEAVDVAEEVALAAGADGRTWAWENEEFRVDLALVPDGGGYMFRYVVRWK